MAKTYREISELREGARTACKVFLAACESQGLDVFVTETYRSQARQDELYAQGRTKPGQIVTWTLKSNHSGRHAWDISFRSTGYNDRSKFERAGKIGKSLGIEWGGDWKKQDLPHYQYMADKYVDTRASADVALLKTATSLTDQALAAGIITDRDLWVRYLTGDLTLSASNLRAFFAKVLPKVSK